MPPSDTVFLRIWAPSHAHLGSEAPVEVTLERTDRCLPAQIRRGDPQPIDASLKHLTLGRPLSLPGNCSYERVYGLPPDLILEPQKAYRISGWVRSQKKTIRIFKFAFRTDIRGLPAAY